MGVTLIVAILLMVLLMGIHLSAPRVEQPPKGESLSMDPLAEQPEEMFIEPILQDPGEENPEEGVEDAPMPQGTPDQADQPSDKLVVNGPNPNKNDESEPKVATKNPSTVKTTTPSEKKQEDSRIASTMKGKFSPHNGKEEGKGSSASSGKGGQGTGVSGTMGNGRRLEHYTLPSDFSINKKTVIKVEVMVNAQGRVESAKSLSGSGSLARMCEKYSLQTRWTPKKGAPLARGVITWTLVPKL